ncbi:MAG: alpha/beta hydrolase [Ferruginibacter sp.]
MKEKHILFQNTTLHYKTTGTGLPIVLLHGFAEDSTIWDNQVEYLKNNYKLIIPDLPGSGGSPMLNTPQSLEELLGVRSDKPIGMEDYAACIKQVLETEKIDRCIMIGHSMGGYITLAFAEKYPGSLICLGLFHSSAYADDDTKVETRKKAISFIEANGTVAFLKTSIPGLFYDQGNSEPADALISKGKSFLPKALVQYYKAMIMRPDRTPILKNARFPVLMIMGEQDKAVPFKHSLEQSYMPFRSYIHILRESAHMGMLEEPGRSNEILANFLLALQPINNV